MNEFQAMEDIENGVNQPQDKPIKWDPESWHMDMGDYILPNEVKDSTELGDLIRAALLSESVHGRHDLNLNGAVSVAYWCSRIGEIVLQAAIDNGLNYECLEDLK